MQPFEWVHAVWLCAATLLEIAANVFLKLSDGFKRKAWGGCHCWRCWPPLARCRRR